MSEWLDHPAVQGGVAPLLVALVVGAAFARTRYAWLAIVAGYATSVALSAGFQFSPLTAGRKIVLVGLLAPLAGIALDRWGGSSRAVVPAVSVAAGAIAVWVFASLFAQREGASLLVAAAGTAIFVGMATAALLTLRDDGLNVGAAGLGLGLATGVAAVLSASIGFLISGVAVAAAAGALLLVQLVTSRNIAAGYTGTLTIGMLCALFATGSVLLAELKWFALPLMLLIPVVAHLRLGAGLPPWPRAALISLVSLMAAAVPITFAWYAARGSLL